MARADTYITRLLPEYVRRDDDGTLATYLAGVGTALAPALRTVDLADPDTSVSGSAELANPAAAPRSWLSWLAYLAGIDVTGLADADVRQAIADSVAGQRRGSVASITRAVRRTLTGARSVAVVQGVQVTGSDYEQTTDYDVDDEYDGIQPDPYKLVVITITSQTPDSAATLAAALTEKPAGLDLEVQTVAASTYQDIKTAFVTYQSVKTAFDTYVDMVAWKP